LDQTFYSEALPAKANAEMSNYANFVEIKEMLTTEWYSGNLI
jgi:hypothetical protein